MPAKRHHLVPQFYLKRWADDRDQVRLIDIREGRDFIANIRDAVVQSGFYNVETDDEAPPDSIENAMAEIEGEAAQAFNTLDAGVWPLDDDNRSALANFIALQIARGQVFRSTNDRAADQVSKMLLQMTAADSEMLRRLARETSDGTEPTDEEMRDLVEFIKGGDFTITQSQTSAVALFMSTAGELVEPVFACSWDLLRVTGDDRLLTSDEPVTMWRAPGAAPHWMGVGLFTADDITFPLDPTHCLRFSLKEGAPDRYCTIGDEDVATINGRTAQGANRYLLAEKTWQPPGGLPPGAAI